ncbi:LysR substrate-binding domain-containing protein [Rhizobium sp. 32-5/1]|uniref:LysR substrate-binding domain-containing protein n=1 Tax=Rhizobium sp. 32-5/1 TaxID=3019602 RepID=UPI00240E910E|nr:LysR substrate-binding domain-containing protein [Rhizobium sp. 32-5/1]WEZ84181.1 LysR substrate-binding domain-containing protein [Rhizobium sp. 32-5/1]
MPVAALRAFEAAARHGQLTAAAEELSVTHGAISRHVSHLEAFIGAPLFEGARNRPKLTAEGRVFGFALTAAFDQIEDAFRLVAKGDESILDVACLSTFAMRWLIPRLHDFAAKNPNYDVRLATDDRPPRTHIDVQILVLSPDVPIPENCSLLFPEQLGLIVAPSLVKGEANRIGSDEARMPRLETRTRPRVWREWSRLANHDGQVTATATRIFDHYHLTIEAALNGLGAAIAPWHLVSEEVACGRLVAPYGFLESDYRYVVKVQRPVRRKTTHFVEWLEEAIAAFPAPTP